MDQDEDRVHLEPGENDDIYPRVTYTKGMSTDDPASRYASGSRTKDLSRYATTLRSVNPFHTGKRSTVKGAAKIDEANLFAFATYSWVFEYLFSAFLGKLDKDQEWNCSVYDASNVNIARMRIIWEEELKKNPKTPSLRMATLRFMSTRLWSACMVFLVCLVFGFIGPTCFIRGLVSFAENPAEDGEIHYSRGLLLVVALGAVELLRVICYGATWAVSYRTGIRVRGALLGLLFEKLIAVRSMGKRNSAEIVNIFANDGQRLFDAVTFAPLVLIGPLVLVGGIVYLLIVIGPWSLLGVTVFFVFDVFQYMLGMTMVRRRQSAIEKTEKRLSLMGEIIKSIRVIKMNSWEENFAARIEQLRHQEKVEIRVAGYAQSLAIACGPVVPVVAAILTFLGVVLSGNDLLASDAFSAITVFFVMLFGIRMIPYGGRYLAEANVSIRRIQDILLMDSYDQQFNSPLDSTHAIRFKQASFSWNPQVDTEPETEQEDLTARNETIIALNGVDLIIKKKELVGVCGAVGSGKSALLTSVIGHLFPISGELEISGSAAYVPQTSWIQNATVQENILFGLPMNHARYERVTAACQLDKDISLMTAKDHTEVGERGTTLSGGQKARVSLARALYSNKEIYLLDDVLASLDRQVADRIFEDAVQNMLLNKTVLMVTSDPQRLALCDRIVFLENGQIVASGDHLTLLEENKHYNSYCKAAELREAISASTVSKALADKVLVLAGEERETVQTEDEIKAEKAKGKLVDDEEDLGTESISFKTYLTYIRAAGTWLIWTVLTFAFILNVAASIFSTFWLSRWLKNGHSEELVETNGTSVLQSSGSLADSPHTPFYASIYGISLVVLFLSGLFKAMVFVKVSLNAGSRLHNGMFSSVIRGALSFFDATPTGRILNRFSKDMDEIDVKLPFTVEVFLQQMITCIGFLLVIAWVFPVFLLACIPLFCIFMLFLLSFRAGIRSLKRSENISRSPLYDHITTSLDGLHCIHSYGQTFRFYDVLKQRMDNNSSSIFMFQSAMRWLAVWLDLLVVMITSVVALLIVLLTGTVSPADAGMAITFAVQMSGIFQFAVRTQTELESKMTSVERVAHYSNDVPSEGEWETKKGVDVPKDWPRGGQITFREVKLRYRPKLPLALNEVSFDVNPGEKMLILGRTGSGKTSLGSVLYRMYPLTGGRIFIDGVDISTLGLHKLRRAMAVIPQDPVLFAGTIRYNLDPNNHFSDTELWTALEKTYMKTAVSNLDKKLEADVQSGGENFSVGEKQLLCMARALLSKVKIVLLDEATASLDESTDQMIQKVITEAFRDCTVLLIAHRLRNVQSYDRCLIMDSGKLVAIDTPSNLLDENSSEIHALALEEREDEIIIPDEHEDNEGTPVRLEVTSSTGHSTPEIVDNNESEDEEVAEMVEGAQVDDVIEQESEDDSQRDDSDMELVEK